MKARGCTKRYRWPVTYADVLPYYERMERLSRIVGNPVDVPNLPWPVVLQPQQLPGDWRKVSASAASAGYRLTPMPPADGPDWSVSRTGVGFNSYTHVVRPLQH